MKATGIVRRVDDLGRIVIPKEIRNTHDLKDGDPVEMFVDGENIVLRKYQPETWSTNELKEALIAAAHEAGKDPVDYLNAVRIHQKEGSATE